MSSAPAPYDLAPLGVLLAIGALLAALPFGWVWLRAGRGSVAQRAKGRLRAVTLLTLCLTFDLVLFGAYTRLSDSGLGCPDWPGCYANASPLGARDAIDAAQAVAPMGPVTTKKAWIEMTHRYLATGVGALIAGLAAAGWWQRFRRRRASVSAEVPPGISPWWPTATLVWVVVQGAFGALTVTWKLYPLIVTAHLLGALVLIALLAAQREAGDPACRELRLGPRLRAAATLLAALGVVQIALGGWVSTNYAVLACADFPSCQGTLWPTMDARAGFQLLRELNRQADGSPLPFAALTAIHMAHRLGALVVLAGMVLLAVALWRRHDAGSQRFARGLGAVALWQAASGVSNVVYAWPLASALAHTAGATVWVIVMTTLLVRATRRPPLHAPSGRNDAAVPMPVSPVRLKAAS